MRQYEEKYEEKEMIFRNLLKMLVSLQKRYFYIIYGTFSATF